MLVISIKYTTLSYHIGNSGVFVGMNPLHALRNEGYDVSPYSPITRLFRNPIYLRVDDVPELRHNENAREHIASPEFQATLAELREIEGMGHDFPPGLNSILLDMISAHCQGKTIPDMHHA